MVVFLQKISKSIVLYMKKLLTSLFALAAVVAAEAKNITITIGTTKYQTVTGFGAACCDGAMCPYGNDVVPVKQLYGPTSKVGLNIMRMEISPNFKGDINAADIGWDTPYDWHGSLPSAKIVKERGGIVFGTPWSPPGEYKTNGSASGGNTEKDDAVRATLRDDAYEKFFPWLNTFLQYMKDNGVDVDAVSIQNEPDWWVNYSGCLYTPQQQVNLVKNYAHMLDRERFPGVRLISAEPLGFTQNYSDALLKDPTARDQIDIIAGHLYGHAPLKAGNMIDAAKLASTYGKEVWMTEHSVTDYLKDRLPNWHEQLLFAEELNECMLAGCTGYIYWYMRAHWSFLGTGELDDNKQPKYGAANKKNVILPRGYVMSHFAKHVTGSTRLKCYASGYSTPKTEDAFESSAYIKGDSIILMAIDTLAEEFNMTINLPYKVKSGKHIVSTGNESSNLCQEKVIEIAESTTKLNVTIPGRSVNTIVFMIDREATDIEDVQTASDVRDIYDMGGRKRKVGSGLRIEKRSDGSVRKVLKK